MLIEKLDWRLTSQWNDNTSSGLLFDKSRIRQALIFLFDEDHHLYLTLKLNASASSWLESCCTGYQTTFLGFSYALYVLRLTTLPVKNDSNDIFATLYEVFLSAMTLGEFFQERTDKVKVDSYVASGGQPWWVFRLLFGVFNFFIRQISWCLTQNCVNSVIILFKKIYLKWSSSLLFEGWCSDTLILMFYLYLLLLNFEIL